MNIFEGNYFNNDLPIMFDYSPSPFNESAVITSACRTSLDPYMRLVSFQESVPDATYQHHDLLPPNNITLKLDVPWTCHSHIIGKSGNTIQSIRRKTGARIHFPDGNKNSETQKSNQVSISSRDVELNGLEEARAYIRELTPLIFTFALPATAKFLVTNINFSTVIAQVQSTYNVQADLQICNEGIPMLLGSVKGTEYDASRVKDATLFLLQNLCGNLASQMPVQVKIEISPQYHSAILGKNSENMKRIMQLTATKIVFPDNSDSTLPALSKYTVTVSGAINNVYLAKQNIIGSLPLVLMFELLPSQAVTQKENELIMYSLNVHIASRPKRADGRCSIIMKCAERNAANLYEAWRSLTKANKQTIDTKIPVTYHVKDNALGLFDFNLYSSQRNVSLTQDSVNNVAIHRHFENLRKDVVYDKIEAVFNVDPYLRKSISSLEDDDTCVLDQFDSPDQPSSLSSSKSENTMADDFQYISDLIPDRRAPGCERKQLNVSNETEDIGYLAKKLLAYKAMNQPVTPKPRTPTSNWSGHGFSKSMPGFVLLQHREEAKIKPENGDGLLGTSLGPWAWDLKGFEVMETLLKDLELQQYIDLFRLNRIDLPAFCELTLHDLYELGITSFGHRKKISNAIKNLRDNHQKTLF